MTLGRAVASVTASLAVAGCAVVAVGMTRSDASHRVADAARPAAPTARPAFVPATGDSTAAPSVTASPTASPTGSAVTHPAATSAASIPVTRAVTTAAAVASTASISASAPPRTSAAPSTTTAVQRAVTHAPVARTTTTRPAAVHTTTAATHPAARTVAKGATLPLGFGTGNARKVITVVAASRHSTTATLQAWSKVKGGWARHGSSVHAHVGTDGLTKHASESRSATPIGSFTLTRAFGHDSNPGTSLPYSHTTPSYWWISQPGKLYNTLQVCSSGCAFNQGNPNEHLYYETPYYDYAVVIDYNTRNAPGGVHQGAGSAFFLHVHPSGTGGTAGCVDIPVAKLVKIMRWLTPQSHARILIGVR